MTRRHVALPACALLAWLVACSASPAVPDAGAVDAGSIDVGLVDAGAADAGPVDAGSDPTPRWGVPGAESTDDACANGADDDHSGYKDCDDFWCTDTPTVQVCGALENTDALCSNGVDDDEKPTGAAVKDGLVDCADPDCSKNPRVTVCPKLQWELGAACENGVDDDGDGLVDCADPDCLHAGSPCPLGDHQRVLFDDAHRERAGNADWVVDIAGRHPFPSVPHTEADWSGQLSAMGKALFDTGHFTIETLPPYGTLTYDEGGQQDLKNYSVLVIPEPSAPLTASEARAVMAFVQAGGGLLMVADHADSDRDGNGWDSVQVFNDMLTQASPSGLEANAFGFSVAQVSFAEAGTIEHLNGGETDAVDPAAIGHPVLAGPHGSVTAVGMHAGGLFVIYGAPAQVLVHALPLGTAGYASGSPYVVAAQVGAGRVVAVGDSSILDDGTDSHGIANPAFDAWHQPTEQNAALFLNAVEWLAR